LPSRSLITFVQSHSVEIGRFITEDDIGPVEGGEREENKLKGREAKCLLYVDTCRDIKGTLRADKETGTMRSS